MRGRRKGEGRGGRRGEDGEGEGGDRVGCLRGGVGVGEGEEALFLLPWGGEGSGGGFRGWPHSGKLLFFSLPL